MEPIELSRTPPPAGVWAWSNSQSIRDRDDASALAQAIVDTIRDPLLVLDQDLRVVTANRAFYRTFRMNFQDIHGRPIYELGDGQWDIPELRLLLEDVAPQHAVMEAYEVERDFPMYRTTLDAPECAGGVQSKKCPQAHSPGNRRCHRPARRRTADGRAAATEGNAVAGDAAPRGKQPADHRKYPLAQGPDRAVGGDPLASAGRARSSHVRGDRPAATPSLGTWRADRAWPLSVQAVRHPGGLHDWRQPADLCEGGGRAPAWRYPPKR